jgi:hypothetical protein
MTDLTFLTEPLARQRIADQLARAEAARTPGHRRPHGRQVLAQRLRRVADRLDG